MTPRERPYRLVQRASLDTPRSGSGGDFLREATSSVWRAAPDLQERFPELREAKRTSPVTVGIWDISARSPYLYDLVEALNVRKDRLLFFEIVASTPLGVEANPDRIESLVKAFGQEIKAEDRQGLRRNVVASDILPRVRRLKERFALDYLVGIVRQPILIESPEELDWDYFAVAQGNVALVSTDGINDYAKTSGRSFEAAVGFLVLGITANAIQDEDLYHEETRGCLFDYNEDRDSLVEGLRAFQLCAQCRRIAFRPPLQEVLEPILAAIKNLTPSTSKAE